VILASEDVGLADPIALVVADAAARAVEFVGLPEAQLNLAEAVIYLSAAPKSNAVTTALGRALADARTGPRAGVPEHLRDSHYPGAKFLGHGEGYVYPHDSPQGWVKQAYRPAEVEGNVYYEPSAHGAESKLATRLDQMRAGVDGTRGEQDPPDKMSRQDR
jgi:putative ATPase